MTALYVATEAVCGLVLTAGALTVMCALACALLPGGAR
jgi:hypothetical protein